LGDARPDAYDRLVDRLLASPHYMASVGAALARRHPLRGKRGIRADLLRPNAWPYRDYVIRSPNEDKPYLQFAREQIAGDVLEPVTRDGITATSFVFGPVDAVGLTSAVESERAKWFGRTISRRWWAWSDKPSRPHRELRSPPRSQVRPHPAKTSIA
jgi:hypothetical protein